MLFDSVCIATGFSHYRLILLVALSDSIHHSTSRVTTTTDFRGETPKEPSQAGLIVLSSQRRSLSRPDDDLRTTQAGKTGRTKDEHVHTMVAPATYSLALSYEGVGGKGTEHWAYFLARTLHELRTGEKYQTAFEIEPEGVISHA
jgi:hypothetical protein